MADGIGAEARGGIGNGAGFCGTGDGDAEPRAEGRHDFRGEERAENQHGDAAARGLLRGERLGELRHGDGGGAAAPERLGNARHAQSVGVGFEDDDDPQRGYGILDFAKVAEKRIQRDVQRDAAGSLICIHGKKKSKNGGAMRGRTPRKQGPGAGGARGAAAWQTPA